MAVEAEKLIAYFDGDVSGLLAAKREADRIIDSLENRLKKQKPISFESGFRQAFSRIERDANKSALQIKGIFSAVLSGSFFASLAEKAVSSFISVLSSLPGLIADLFKKASNYSQLAISLAQFEGSVDSAQKKIKELIELAASTPGLTFLSAVDGQKRLEGIGFAADKATQILAGLAKVRLLSGSTKEDYDAVILNLTQIASGGQKVGQEIRELIGRMPAFARIIKETFGTLSGEELNKLDPKEFVSKLAEATAQLDVQFASSSLAAENLSDAVERLQIAIGGIIEQNPEVIALLRLWAQELDSVSLSLADNESQQRSTFSSFISWLAGAAVKVENFADRVKTNFQLMVNFANKELQNIGDAVGSFVLIIVQAVKTIVSGAVAAVATGLDLVVNGMQRVINGLVNWINSVSFQIPGIPQLPEWRGLANFAEEMRKATVDAFDLGVIATNTFFLNLERNRRRSEETLRRNIKLVQDYEIRVATRNLIFKNLTERERRATAERNSRQFKTGSGLDDSTTGTGEGSSLRGRARKAKNTDTRTSEDIAAVARALGFETGQLIRKNLNEGSLHAVGKALDISVRGKSEQEIGELIAALLKKGFRVVDERMKIPGVNQTGPHIHAEVNDRKESYLAWNPKLGYGNIPVGLLRKLDEQRFARSRGGIDKDDIKRYLAQESDELTRAEREARLRQTFEIFKKMGWTPGALLDDFTRLLVEDARRGLDVTGRGAGIQPTRSDVEKMFEEARIARQPGEVTVEPAQISDTFTPEMTPGQDFIQELRDSLNLRERYKNLLLGEKNLSKVISVLVENRNVQLEEARSTAEKEYQALLKRNIAEEVSVGLFQSKTRQTQELGDIERDLAILRAQNNNAEFVAQRRLAGVKAEQLSLEQQITRLQDEVVNGGVNEGLKVQIALLEDVLRLRELETQKIIEANRSLQYRLQIQLAQLPSYGVQIKDFFGNLPTAIGDVFAQGLQQWDGTWKGFLQSIRQSFAQLLSDLAAQLLRSAIIRLAANLIGSLFGGSFNHHLAGGLGPASGIGVIGGASGGLPGLADGGTAYAGMPHIVGERGPEIFVPKHTGTVISNRDSKKLLAQSGVEKNVNVTINQTIAAPRGLVAPKSARQAADATVAGVSRFVKRQN